MYNLHEIYSFHEKLIETNDTFCLKSGIQLQHPGFSESSLGVFLKSLVVQDFLGGKLLFIARHSHCTKLSG